MGMLRKILTKILMFGKAVVKIPSLDFSKVGMRQVQFDEIEDQARAFAEPVYTDNKKNIFFDESVGTEAQLDPREKFKVENFYTILDCLRNELEHSIQYIYIYIYIYGFEYTM
jgi:hypothetical protein